MQNNSQHCVAVLFESDVIYVLREHNIELSTHIGASKSISTLTFISTLGFLYLPVNCIQKYNAIFHLVLVKLYIYRHYKVYMFTFIKLINIYRIIIYKCILNLVAIL